MRLCGNAQAGNWPPRRKRASGMHQAQFSQTKDISMPKRLHPVEFVALMAMTMATVAFSIDSMLPALTEIGRELAGGNAKDAQLVLSSFMVGMGVGTLFTGPLSDSFGAQDGDPLRCLRLYRRGADRLAGADAAMAGDRARPAGPGRLGAARGGHRHHP